MINNLSPELLFPGISQKTSWKRLQPNANPSRDVALRH